jgi:hypothetical protein
VIQLKKLYGGIPTLETRILNEDFDEKGRVMRKGRRRCQKAKSEEID